MLRDFFLFIISFSAFPLKAENELISGRGTNGSILVGNSFLSQTRLEILKRTSDFIDEPGEQSSMGHIMMEGVIGLN